jgi:hypothetical protein
VLTAQEDNKGFYAWVMERKEELRLLGPGLHRGEFWGAKIGRKYGGMERRFSLFNVSRWMSQNDFNDPNSFYDYLFKRTIVREKAPTCCHVVPVLGVLPTLDLAEINGILERLRVNGSVACPGWMKPEGVVMFHTASSMLLKATCEDDDKPKGVDQ